jgi:ABC-type multidrug transport system ATPase subunit
VLKPGRLTLLLGTPGSGRTLLLKALAGRLGQEKTLKVRRGCIAAA